MLHAAAQSVDFSNQLIDVSKLFTQNKMCWDWNKRAYARGTKSLLVDLKKPKILRDTSKTREFSGVFTSIPLILLLSHISRWERSIFWQLSAENATFRWWFSHCYMLCWMPYGIVALMATFGGSGLVTPITSVIPSILAKFSTVVNPVIYVFFNKQVRVRT